MLRHFTQNHGMKRFFLLLLLCLTIFGSDSYGQAKNTDSLWAAWNNTQLEDTARLDAIYHFAWQKHLFTNPDSAYFFAEQMLSFAVEKNERIYESDALRLIGVTYLIKGVYVEASDYYHQALNIRVELGDQKRIAASLNDIAGVYQNQGDLETALDYYRKSLAIFTEIQDKSGLARCYNNIASVYDSQGQKDSLLIYFNRSYELNLELEKTMGAAINLMNIGSVYMSQEVYDTAIIYGEKAHQMMLETERKEGIANSLNFLGSVYFNQSKIKEGVPYFEKALDLSKEVGSVLEERQSTFFLHKSYKTLGNYQKALLMHERHVVLVDSMRNKDAANEVIRQKYQYEYMKQAAEDSIKNAEADKIRDAELIAERAENNQRKQLSYFLYTGLGLTVLFGIFIFSRFRVSQRQKELIEKQKLTVEGQNQEILDSIQYAKRIQAAILPSSKSMSAKLKNHFVFYKPKDIVAGDFFWMEEVDDKILFAVADCTGHGVPGAMVSVICNNGLNRSVREDGLSQPAEILNKTREIVISEFEKSEEEVKDGMDIALCTLKGLTLEFAGANNPLWIIRRGSDHVEEIKGDKQPIGKYSHQKQFQNHQIQLQKGDSIYLFSDGFADQFGGENAENGGKKFKSSRFKKLLLSIQQKSMEEQQEALQKAFYEWKGNLDQLDDVCVIGLRI